MQVTLLGAAYEVTGSAYLLETGRNRVLIDCGLFQGSQKLEKLNHIPALVKAEKLDAVLLTHGHLDHCGRLPLLLKAGYFGPVYASPGTIDIAKLILSDAARIQEDDCARENRKRSRLGLEAVKPLFSQKDVLRVFNQFKEIEYNKNIRVCESVEACFVEAGHILGSTSIILNLTDENQLRKKLVFSGDIGQWDTPIVKDPTIIREADWVFVESTYGNRDHRTLSETVEEFENLLLRASERKGKILIPTFAVGRTQQILYHLAEFFRKKVIDTIPVYLDSPMAAKATELYARHPELMDQEAYDLQESGQLRRDLRSLRTCIKPEESQALNSVEGPCIILAGSGMCNAGRILHHFRHNLSNENTVVIIVGYQARGSLGRMMLEGAKRVKIFSETIHVNAEVRGLGGFSAHAGQTDLLRWLSLMAEQNAQLILTHGESVQINEFARKIEERFSIRPLRPKLGDCLQIN